MPGPEEIDARDLARLAFRGEPSSEQGSAAARAAEMRKAVVQREPQDFRAVQTGGSSLAPIGETPVAEMPQEVSLDDVVVGGAMPGLGQVQETGAVAAEAPVVQKMAALVYAEPGAPPVYATTSAPAGLYTVRVRQRSYWVPGAAQASATVQAAIEKAKAATPSSGTTVVVVEQGGGPPVVLTDTPPIDGTFSVPAGERHAWIAGVATPEPAQRAAIAAAIAAVP